MSEKLNIKYIDIMELVPYINNARTHSDEQILKLQSSLREFGFINPVIIDKDKGVIAGHGRIEAAKREGIKNVPCVSVEHLTEAQKKAYILADNRLAEDAGWDEELLKIELEALQAMEFDVELTGFEMDFDKDESEAQEDDYEIIVPEEPKTNSGDIFRLGRHRLMCGDSTDLQCVEQLMNGNKADMLLTDPPYNVDYEGTAGKIKNDNMSDESFREFLCNAFKCADEVMKEGAVFYIWHADLEGYNFRGACYDVGWKVRQCLIWNKNSLVMGRQDYHWKHEPCLYGWKEGSSHLWASDRKQTTVINFDKPSRNAEHPTMKPVALFDYQIKNNTKSEDIVLDVFAGSGTAIIACEQNGRTSYSMELDPKYCDVIINRWETLTGQKAVLINE